MNTRIENAVLVALLSLALGSCRDAPKDDVEVVAADVGQDDTGGGGDVEHYEITGNERWLQPGGTARITFYVDDSANQTFEDGQIKWTGSFAWNSSDNTIVYAMSWLPDEGPYPLLYDDGPVRDGGHEMAGATAGDHIFSTEVYFKAEDDTTFDYGVLNELDFWMWSGPNGQILVPKGSRWFLASNGLFAGDGGGDWRRMGARWSAPTAGCGESTFLPSTGLSCTMRP